MLFVVLRNGGYAIMDRLAEREGDAGPWPRLDALDLGAMARAQGGEAIRVEDHAALLAWLDDVLEGLAAREAPLLLEVVVAPDPALDP